MSKLNSRIRRGSWRCRTPPTELIKARTSTSRISRTRTSKKTTRLRYGGKSRKRGSRGKGSKNTHLSMCYKMRSTLGSCRFESSLLCWMAPSSNLSLWGTGTESWSRRKPLGGGIWRYASSLRFAWVVSGLCNGVWLKKFQWAFLVEGGSLEGDPEDEKIRPR